MTDPLDRILATDPAMHPSPGFASRVMRRLLGTPAPPPLTFPWKPFTLAATILAATTLAILWLATHIHTEPNSVPTLLATTLASLGALYAFIRTP